MQKSKRFSKKHAVRFQLVPGFDENGNPTTTFKPVETRNKLSKKERQKLINQFSDYQIEIDGKPVFQSEIPSFVLEQIKGRADLVFVQKNPDLIMKMREEENQENMGYEEEMEQMEDIEGEMIPEDEYMGAEDVSIPEGKERKKIQDQEIEEKGSHDQKEDEEEVEVEVFGKKYKLTKKKLKQLEQVLPENYKDYQIQGVQFAKYDEYGNKLEDLQKYKKYLVTTNQKRAIMDSLDYVPDKPVDVVDNDLQGQQLKGDLKQIEDALNYEGDDNAYEQLEDDFFAQLLQGQTKKPQKNDQTKIKQTQAFKKKKSQQPKPTVKIQQKQKQSQQQKKYVSKMDQLEGDDDDYQDVQEDEDDYEDQDSGYEEGYEDQEITDQMLDRAIQEFDRKVQNRDKNRNQEDEDEEEQVDTIAGTGIPKNVKGMELIKFIQTRDGCIGKDGELDWRTLTKKQKRQYMKNKKIRSIYQQVRQRQIEQKLKNKKNVKAQDLHLKKYIQHIPYKEDHVMQQAIKKDQQQVIDINAPPNQQDFETESDQDDIISYRAKTSIISSNLATVQQGESKRKKRKDTQLQSNSQHQQQQQQQSKQKQKQKQKIKVVPQKRNRNETSQQRKQRKQKLKQMKKQKKQQKKQFNQMFQEERKKVMKRGNASNTNNPLHKVSYVKIA